MLSFLFRRGPDSFLFSKKIISNEKQIPWKNVLLSIFFLKILTFSVLLYHLVETVSSYTPKSNDRKEKDKGKGNGYINN